MKRMISFLLCLIVLLCLVGCNINNVKVKLYYGVRAEEVILSRNEAFVIDNGNLLTQNML